MYYVCQVDPNPGVLPVGVQLAQVGQGPPLVVDLSRCSVLPDDFEITFGQFRGWKMKEIRNTWALLKIKGRLEPLVRRRLLNMFSLEYCAVVEQMPHFLVVTGLNPPRCRAFIYLHFHSFNSVVHICSWSEINKMDILMCLLPGAKPSRDTRWLTNRE